MTNFFNTPLPFAGNYSNLLKYCIQTKLNENLLWIVEFGLKNFDVDSFSAEELYKMVGSNVARIRKAKGVSQLDLALSIGLKSSGLISVAEIYHNKRHFNLEHLYKIAAVLECDVCEFFRPIH